MKQCPTMRIQHDRDRTETRSRMLLLLSYQLGTPLSCSSSFFPTPTMDADDHTECCHTIATLPTPCHAQCAHCGKRERHLPADTKLKRCMGCSVVRYCSRECQKAAWPEHRRVVLSLCSCLSALML